MRSRHVRGRSLFAYNGTNTTVPQVPISSPTYLDPYPDGGATSTSHGEELEPTDCPTGAIISTTTLEVTIYVTEVSYDEVSSIHETASLESSATTSRWLNQTVSSTTVDGHVETPDPDGDDHGYYPPGPVITHTGDDYYHTPTHVYGNSTAFSLSTTVEIPAETTTRPFTTGRYWNTTSAGSSETTKTGFSTLSLHTTGRITTSDPVPKPTDDCVIDTYIVPVTTATLTIVPSATDEPTTTVSEEDAPTGTPQLNSRHCGVHGLPVGNYFIARFVENSKNVPVTLEGCYQFCNVSETTHGNQYRPCLQGHNTAGHKLTSRQSVMDATKGCQSYRFYPESGLDVPRCDLYGSSVAYALDKIEDDHPDIWFDLECGSPRSPRWAGLPGLARLAELGLE